jgi:chemotaxis protein methyltransferase CheR
MQPAPRRSGSAAPGAARMTGFAQIGERDFQAIRAWIRGAAGISLSDQKKALVAGRLASRLRHYGLDSYGRYFELLQGGTRPDELQIAVDLLTTNETHFFREPKHFDFLRGKILPGHPAGRPFRVWSAASSSGEEPYSIAMTLAESLREAPWEVVASDLSSRVLARAQTGHYAMTRAKTIPRPLLSKYCLKGVGAQEGTFLVEPGLRSRVRFMQVNLVNPLPQLREFDVIFLRNVMIYFDAQTKREVVSRMLPHLARGGHIVVGHSESLNGLSDALASVQPSIYRKP